MRRYLYLFFVIYVCNSFISASEGKRTYEIKCTITNCREIKKAYLYDYSNGKYNLIDTTIIKNGEFIFQLASDSHPGIYKIRLTPDKVIENIIFNFEDIVLKADLNRINESLEFMNSDENRTYLEYSNYLKGESLRVSALKYLLSVYSSDDEFYKELQKEYIRLRNQINEKVKTFAENNAGLLACKIIRYEQIPNSESDTVILSNFLQQHFWDNFDFTDTILNYLPILSSKVDDYFALFEYQNLNREQQEENFKMPAEFILQKVKDNKAIFSVLLKDMLNDFEKFGLFNLYDFIAEKYLSNLSCINENRLEELREKVGQKKLTAIGNKARNFQITKNLNLYDIEKDFVLLVFWESSCPYCHKVLDELKSVYDTVDKKKYEVVGISLDTNSINFKKSVLENGFEFISICDFLGWDSPVVKDYVITSTPVLFLLDKNKIIIDRPVNVRQFLMKIKKAG